MRVPGRLAAAGLLLLCLPGAAAAAPVSCHCFRDREYDPAHPGASDVYLLATAANTLLSAAYGIPKREIVQARMSGTSGEDLWIAAFAASRQGAGIEDLMKARAQSASWKLVFQGRGGPLEPLGPRFVAALAGGADDIVLSRIAAAETLAAGLATPWPELEALAAGGATLQETVLAALLGVWSSRRPGEIFAQIKAGGGAWSRLLAAEGLEPKQMEVAVPEALRPAGRPPKEGARPGSRAP